MIPVGRPFSSPEPSRRPSPPNFSSTLSPLAPPFRVDAPSSPPPLAPGWPSDHRSKPFPYAAPFVPQRSVGVDVGVAGEEHPFGSVPNPSFGRGWDLEGFEHSLGIEGKESFMGPPHYEIYPSLTGIDRHSTYEDHPYSHLNGTCDNFWPGNGQFGSGTSEWLEDKQTENYRNDIYSPFDFSAPFLEPSSSFEKTFYSSVPSSTLGMECSNSYMPKSPYDKYMALLDSCLPDEIPFQPITSLSMSTQIYASPREGASSLMATMLKQGVHNRVVIIRPAGTKNSDDGVGDNEDIKDKIVKEITGASSVAETVEPAGPVRDVDGATTKFSTGLKMKCVTTASTSTSRATGFDNSLKHSTEIDGVDSPCWRGAPSSQVFPHAVGKTETIHSKTNGSKNADEIGQTTEGLSKIIGSPKMPVEGRNISTNSCTLNLDVSPITSSRMLRQPGASHEDGLEGKIEIVHQDEHVEKERCSVPQESVISHMENIATDKIQLVDEISNCNKGSDPSPYKNFKHLAKEILNMSVDLLCVEFGASELERDAFRPLISARNNIDLILKEKKTQSSTADDSVELQEFGCYDAHFRSINQINKNLEDVMKKTLPEKEENSVAVLYKNLWLEAEALICKLKYELKLATMKVKMESGDQLPKGKPPTSPSSSCLKSISERYGHLQVNAEESFEKPSDFHWSEADLGDPLVETALNRPQVIKFADLNAPAMAQYKTPEDLTGTYNTWVMNKLGIPNNKSGGSSSRVREPVYASMAADADNAEQDMTTLAALGFTETTGPYATDNIWTPLAKLKPLKFTGVRHNNDHGPSLNSSDNASMNSLKEQPANRINGRGNSSLAAGYENFPYEWEHVFKEESN